MKKIAQNPDKVFIIISGILIILGIFAFTSAALGVLSKDTEKFYGLLISQGVLGLVGGGIACIAAYKIPLVWWRVYGIHIFCLCLLLTACVYIPGVGFSHGGARRWIDLGPVSFQPAEFLKIGFIFFCASWFSRYKSLQADWRYSFLPVIAALAGCALVLFFQPDTKSFLLLSGIAAVILFTSGTPLKYLGMSALFVVLLVGIVLLVRPYARDRVRTFLDPERDPRGASYQLQQALISIGAGGFSGRGYGQSVQKFHYLPEAQGDAVFAVVGEETGFIGSATLIVLYVLFALRGFRIGYRAPDVFSRTCIMGAVSLIVGQSFLNILSITGLFPLTGVPLVFISHGGTSLLVALFLVGLVAHISRYQKKELVQQVVQKSSPPTRQLQKKTASGPKKFVQ